MDSLLSTIRSPLQLKKLSLEELELLASEIRESIIDVMAINGGHLGSNLGIVELSIALHRTFTSPIDRFIFDVSHQVYPHKLLTGRQKEFPSIRLSKGLSGFANPLESPHDHFFAGHAGTALSLALGVAHARDLKGERFQVVPIIGDATFTCGLSLEALNNIPTLLSRFTLILNDNNMSISNNVGAITRILTKNGACAKTFFEQYGLDYVGVLDGHNLEELLKVLEEVKDSPRPTLLHVKTVKGKGLNIAEENPIPWHGCSPFDKVTGKKLAQSSVKAKFPQIFGKHLHKMMQKEREIVTVTPAMPHGSCIGSIMEEMPTRCLDVGIAEGHAVTFSAGIASKGGAKVVCSIYATFLQRALDNLFQDVCLQGIPVLFALDRAGLATGDGATHHGIYDLSFLRSMPNMIICQPRNGHLLKELLESAFDWKRPVAIRYPNMDTEEPDLPIGKRELGKGELLLEGTDVALIALGHMVSTAFEVSDLLGEVGISAAVIDPIFVKPLDENLLTDLFLRFPLIVTIEEHAVATGLGSALLGFASEKGFSSAKIKCFGIGDLFVHHGSHRDLLKELALDPRSLASEIQVAYTESGLLKAPV